MSKRHPRTCDARLLVVLSGTLRYLPDVLRFVLRRVGDRELSADLAAEVFAAALEARSTFDPARGSAVGWLCAVASNKIVDSHRRGQVEDICRRRLGMAAIALEDDDLRRVDEIAAARDAVGPTEELLAGLAPDTRAAVAARVLDEREYGDIAAQLSRRRMCRGGRLFGAWGRCGWVARRLGC